MTIATRSTRVAPSLRKVDKVVRFCNARPRSKQKETWRSAGAGRLTVARLKLFWRSACLRAQRTRLSILRGEIMLVLSKRSWIRRCEHELSCFEIGDADMPPTRPSNHGYLRQPIGNIARTSSHGRTKLFPHPTQHQLTLDLCHISCRGFCLFTLL